MTSEIRSVGVVGAGQMGAGIAQVAAVAGFPTVVRDVGQEQLARGRKAIEQSLAKLVEKGKVDAATRDAALGRLTFVTELEPVAAQDLVIEAIVEDLEAKNTLWADLNRSSPPRSIFASNTSSLSIAAMVQAAGRGDLLCGLHFFNPVPLMALVEVVRSSLTSQATLDSVMGFVARLGKQPIIAKDTAGFVVNRLLIPYMLDAIRVREAGLAGTQAIDMGMQLGCNHPMGPLALADFTGLDIALHASESLYREFAEPRFAPPPLLRRMVTLGLLGRKTGRGFYDYSVTPPRVTDLGIGGEG